MKHGWLLVLLLAGCEPYQYESPAYYRAQADARMEAMQAKRDAEEAVRVEAYQKEWGARIESFKNSLRAGMEWPDIKPAWGSPHEIDKSVIGDTEIKTFVYDWYGPIGAAMYPIETYHLVFVNGRLAEYHKF